jgi:hypothetical protein
MQLIRNHTGIYSIKLPLSLDELYDAVIKIDTIPTFSTYFPLVKKLPVDLNQIRVANDREAFASDVSDIYEIPDIFPPDSDRFIVGIQSIKWLDSVRYQGLTSSFENIPALSSYFPLVKELGVAQGAANLASVIEPPQVEEFIEPNRFRLANGNYYRDRVVLVLEVSYSESTFDIPMNLRGAFFKLALLQTKAFLHDQLWRIDGTEAVNLRLQLGTDKWEDCSNQADELVQKWKSTDRYFYSGAKSCYWI